jgi:hypothetical protein
MTPLGVRGKAKSVAAMKRPRKKATVVKKPKVFCTRVTELYILSVDGSRRGSTEVKVWTCSMAATCEGG